ncbi:hypothetical protein ACHAXS_002678 [Conticribra weissflogii]
MTNKATSKLCNFSTRASLLNFLLLCSSGSSSRAARHHTLGQFTVSGCQQHSLLLPSSYTPHCRGHNLVPPVAFASCSWSTGQSQGNNVCILSHPLSSSPFHRKFRLPQRFQLPTNQQKLHQTHTCSIATVATTKLFAAPKRGNVVNTYQTVSVNCSSCKHRLFRYKKKNGTKSNLIKCYVERIVGNDKWGLDESDANRSDVDDGNVNGDIGDDIDDGAHGLLKQYYEKKKEMEWKYGEARDFSGEVIQIHCPKCGVNFARSAVIKGRPAWKLVGGKTRMTKK